MHIEVIAPQTAPAKAKGDLFESLASDFLKTQGYAVESQVRTTATELDLLCKHNVSGALVYVECKAERDPLSAVPIRTLLGTVSLNEYSAGWLVSAGPLGRDAKGLKLEWELKPPEQRRQLLIYDPNRVIDALVHARIVVDPKTLHPTPSSGPLADWVLLVASVGRFWLAPILQAGVPRLAALFDATSGRRITETDLWTSVAATDCSLRALSLDTSTSTSPLEHFASPPDASPPVVQVIHADTWADYRPSRPTDFIGREEAQEQLLSFLTEVRQDLTRTRVFAITGDTGIGKSSLVAKLRARLENTRNRTNFSVLAVDMRAAHGPEYVLRSLLECLRSAADAGYGRPTKPAFEVTNAVDPLASPSISQYLTTVSERRQVICLVLDQFEELYSKPDLFTIFEQAQRLLLSCAAAASAFVIGFVFRSDSLVQQNHPAYYMWNRLADYRYELRLRQFSAKEISSALTNFEKELHQRLRPDLRRKLAENCAGLPWLLKKLCIHVLEQIRDGRSQRDLDNTMDVESLFARDLGACSTVETQCLRLVARQSPADWSEVVEMFGVEVVRPLQERRLIIRNGDRLNLYWDVFREYVLTKQVPSIPFTYLWSSPSIGAFLTVAARLSRDASTTADDLSSATGLSVKTVGNVLHDLLMFGVGSGTPASFRLEDEMPSGMEVTVLERLRIVLRRHAFTRWLAKWPDGSVLGIADLITGLREIKSTAKHSDDTWRMYAERLGPWFVAAGLIEATPKGWSVRDVGGVRVPSRKGNRFRVGMFLGDAPPARVALALQWLVQSPKQSNDGVCRQGFRNAMRVLERLELTMRDDLGRYEAIHQPRQLEEAERYVFEAACRDETLVTVREWLNRFPTASGREVGSFLAEREGQNWTAASKQRIGNALWMWAAWISQAPVSGTSPRAPGPRVRKAMGQSAAESLFLDSNPRQ